MNITYNMRAVVNTSPFCEKDEVHELGDQLSKQPFNVLANKRLKKARPLVTEARDSVNRIRNREDAIDKDSLQLIEQTAKPREASLTKVSQLLQGARNSSNVRFNTFQTHFSSHSRDKQAQKFKMNQTVSVKRSRQSEAVSSSKKSESSLQLKSQSQQQARRSKAEVVKAMEKQYNQGQLKEKHLMNWLNQILIEYCFEQPLEKGQLKALERFGLDQTTLLSQGMTLHDSSRLYKMLFVYSMGFNNILKELGTSRSTLKSIWKVYAVLLEYCSEGNFETIMGELERDMMKNEQRLIKQIEKRQEEIDNHEEIMEERLHKYSKENKELTLRVRSLEEKTEVLEKEFREMEMAYNMEVTLRLAYQYKINEIYSVHEKLNILHLNLYKELQEKTAEGKKAAQECWQAKQIAGELKADKEQITGYMVDLKNAITLHENMIEGLRMNEQQLRDKLFAEQSAKREEVLELRERDKKIGQLEREVNSSNLMVGIMKSASDSHLVEYRRLMLENSDLRRVSQGQLEKINQLLSDIKYLNSKESTLKSELAHAEAKIRELQERLVAQQAVGDDLAKQLQRKEVELRTKCVEYESQKRLAESVERNMKEIKLLYDRLEEDNNLNKKYALEINKQFEKAHQRTMTLELEVKAVHEQKFQVELDLSRKASELLSLRKKLDADVDQQQRQYDKLHKLWSGQDSTQSSLAQQLATTQGELETANIRISFLSEKFTDLNFEKSKIEAIYNDNLVLHDRQKDAQKTLMIQISTLNEQLEQAHRTIELTNKTAQHQLDKMAKEKAQVETLLRKREAALKKKEGFVHPMLLEDALETLKRQIESHYSTRISLENEVEKEGEKNNSLSLELQKKEADFRQHVKELERRAEKMREQIQSERQYFQGKSEQLNSLIYNLETQLTFKSLEAERKDDGSAEAKFAELVRNKNSQIQELLGELERIEDSYQQKCTHYEEEIEHIHLEKEAAIVNLKQSKKELEIRVVEIEKNYQEKLELKEREKEAIVQKMLEQRAIAEEPAQEEQEQEDRPLRQDKRSEFIARLKFANAYYHK